MEALPLVLLALSVSLSQQQPSVLGVDQSRLEIGEEKLREWENKASHSPCWSEAVRRLDHSCKQLSDVEQSRLAVAFANCHLDKSGRQTYPCTEEMSIRECTGTMDHDGYQTYTHFFTHTGHICYFLQIELWQGRTEGLIGRLSATSIQAVEKLERSLEYHRVMDDKQSTALHNQDLILQQDQKIITSLQQTHTDMEASFNEMSTMAESQKALLGEMFGSLQSSLEAVRGVMSLMVVEIIGWETLVLFVVSWVVVMFLPQFHYSRFKLVVVLLAEGMVEVCVRKMYGYLVMGGETPPTDLTSLHHILWVCRYVCVALSLVLYVWEWVKYEDYGERNYRLLSDIRHLLRTGREEPHLQQKSPSPKRGAAIPLPYVPLHTAQPGVFQVDGVMADDSPDSPDSTHHHSHHHSHHYVMSSDEDETCLAPDNNRTITTSNRKTTRGQRSSAGPSRHLQAMPRVEHSPSFLLPNVHLSSDDDDDVSNITQSLTRTPIHTPSIGRHKLNSSSARGRRKTAASTSSTSSRRPLRAKARSTNTAREGEGASTPHTSTSDPEPEKEVVEEKDAAGGGGISGRSLRTTDQFKFPAVPARPHPLPPPTSTPSSRAPRRSRSPTPAGEVSHRYNLRSRSRTPQPDH